MGSICCMSALHLNYCTSVQHIFPAPASFFHLFCLQTWLIVGAAKSKGQICDVLTLASALILSKCKNNEWAVSLRKSLNTSGLNLNFQACQGSSRVAYGVSSARTVRQCVSQLLSMISPVLEDLSESVNAMAVQGYQLFNRDVIKTT